MEAGGCEAGMAAFFAHAARIGNDRAAGGEMAENRSLKGTPGLLRPRFAATNSFERAAERAKDKKEIPCTAR